MTNQEFVLSTMRDFGAKIAEEFQTKTSKLTSDEIYEQDKKVPDFNPQKQYLNYPIGFVCKSPTGNLVKLLQPYDSTIFQDNPEDLPAQWGFFWPTEPRFAKSFVESATSPYNKDNVCLYDDHIWKSGMDNNVWPPGTPNVPWEDLGPKENFQ